MGFLLPLRAASGIIGSSEKSGVAVVIPDKELKLIQSDIHHVAARFAGMCRRRIPKADFEQSAWVRVLADWDKFDACKSSRRTWARRVATAGIIDAMRTPNLQSGIVYVARPAYQNGFRAPKTCPVKCHHKATHDEEAFAREDFYTTVQSLVDRKLNPKHLAILWCIYHDDMTIPETADKFGMSHNSVNQLLYLLRKEIRETIDISEIPA